MGHAPAIFHDFHRSGIYPGPSETRIYCSGLSGIIRGVAEPSSSTSIFRTLAFRVGKMTCFSENGHFAYVNPLLSSLSNLDGVHKGFGR